MPTSLIRRFALTLLLGLLSPLAGRLHAAPQWIDEQAWSAEARRLPEVIRATHEHGLSPSHYLPDAVDAVLRQTPSAVRAATLTQAWEALAADLANGRVHGVAEWQTMPMQARPSAWQQLLPQTAEYRTLQAEYGRLLGLKAQRGSYAWLDPREHYQPPLEDRVKAQLRLRLQQAGVGDVHSETGSLREAIAHAQRRFALLPSGEMDAATIAALNVPLSTRLRQLRAVLDRLRRQRAWPADRLHINIPAFTLTQWQAGHAVANHRVIVGRTDRPTPELVADLRSIVLNPTWTVPPTIFHEDKLPALLKNPQAFSGQGFSFYRTNDGRQQAVSPASVDWAAVAGGRESLRMVQAPGPNNALGQVKFLFPNRYSVYLHDTPSRHLFDEPQRMFSSGCVRLEAPLALAGRLLAQDRRGQPIDLQRIVRSGTTTSIPLSTPLAVVLDYQTAVLSDAGELVFFNDIYGRDARWVASLDDTERF